MDKLLTKNVKEFIIGFFLLLATCVVIYCFKSTWNCLLIIFILLGSYIIIGTTYLVIDFINGVKKYYKTLKQEKPTIRFKYIDTFYFLIGDSTGEISTKFVYHILQDTNSNKLYAMRDQNKTNIVLFNNNVYRIEVFKKEKIEINDEGNMWIDEEEKDIYKKIDGIIKIYNSKLYYDEKDKVKNSSQLFNINPNNDASILDKVTFVYGLAEIDKKQH